MSFIYVLYYGYQFYGGFLHTCKMNDILKYSMKIITMNNLTIYNSAVESGTRFPQHFNSMGNFEFCSAKSIAYYTSPDYWSINNIL